MSARGKRRVGLAGLLLATALVWGCATARRGEPLRGPLALDAEAKRGERVFMRYCHACHPGGEGGLGPALSNKPVPAFVKKFQVRHGLGAMPSFSDRVLNDQDLDALMSYLGRLRSHRAKR